MIPYEELVAALNHWRAQQGLPTGDTDFLGAPPPTPTNLVEVPEAHLSTGDSTDTVDVSDIEVLSEETAYEYDDQQAGQYDDQQVGQYDDQQVGQYDDQQAAQYDDQQVVADGQQAVADDMPDLDYDEQPIEYEAQPAGDAEPLAQAPAPEFGDDEATSYDAHSDNQPVYADDQHLEPPPIVDVPADQDRAGTEEEATLIAGGHGDDLSIHVGVEDDEATRVAADDGHAMDEPRPTLDTDVSSVVSEDELPPIPPVGGEDEHHAASGGRNDATIDIDPGADVIDEIPAVAGEIGGDKPKPE